MLTGMELEPEVILNATTQEVLIVCESAEHSLLGQTKQTFTFTLPPNASVDVVREMLADKLSTASNCVHLQVLVRESNEYETVTRGSVADALAASNPATSTLTFVYTTESRYGCFYVCCAALCAGCCCAGYQAGKANERDRQRRRS